MPLLIAGVVLWGVAHLFKAAAPRLRDRVARRLGDGPYRGLFSLVIVGSLVLIVLGWRTSQPQILYRPPLDGGILVAGLVLAGIVLFFAAQFDGNIKRFVRHPQMSGTLLWSTAHLLANGDNRSAVLFGGFAVWSLLEIVLINRRDGARPRPGTAALRHDLVPIIFGALAFAALWYFHQTLFGVSVR